MTSVSRNKLQLGEDLFHKVAEIETELCAQVTGKCDIFMLKDLMLFVWTPAMFSDQELVCDEKLYYHTV